MDFYNKNNAVLVYEYTNRMKIPEIYPKIWGNLRYDKGGISNYWGKDRLTFLMVLKQPLSHFRKW